MKAAPSATAVYSDFKQAFPEMAQPGANGGTASDKKRSQAAIEAYKRAMKQGWTPATIINMHPFQLDLNMGYLGHLTVPARKQGTPYFKLVVDQPRLDMEDTGDNKFIPTMYFPKALAEDLVNHYIETGGVFCYEGVGDPDLEQIEAAMANQLTFYWNQFNEGNANWAQFRKNPRYITERMRDGARELLRLKLISDAPEWMVVTRSESPMFPCEGCGQSINKIAKFCPECHTIYDAEWVKLRRKDLWLAQNPGPAFTAQDTGATGASAPDIDKFIKDEAEGTGPERKPRRPLLSHGRPGVE